MMDNGKAAVMWATGRSDQVKQSEGKPIGDVIAALRKAAG